MIYETIVSTQNIDADIHLSPMGVIIDADNQSAPQTGNAPTNHVTLAPFRPSTTLDNILRERVAVINYTTDSRIFAACVCGKDMDWPLTPTDNISGRRLTTALAHAEVELLTVDDDAIRPRLHCRVIHTVIHQAFRGFNRAQSAVIELAILTSRLDRLPAEKIDAEIAYLKTAVEKTAGKHEKIAWRWLMDMVDTYRSQQHHGKNS